MSDTPSPTRYADAVRFLRDFAQRHREGATTKFTNLSDADGLEAAADLLEQGQRDTARLDWLEQRTLIRVERADDNTWLRVDTEEPESAIAEGSLREAIDAARESQP